MLPALQILLVLLPLVLLIVFVLQEEEDMNSMRVSAHYLYLLIHLHRTLP